MMKKMNREYLSDIKLLGQSRTENDRTQMDECDFINI